MVGHIILIISAIPGIIEKDSAIGAFAIAIVIMGLGTGGFKSNISPLIAEQYKRTKLFVTTTKSGERVIVDPALTTAKIYMVSAFNFNVYLSHYLTNPTSVLLPLRQYRCSYRSNHHDICREIRWLLARVHTPHRRIPSMPSCPLVWSQQLRPITSYRFRPCDCLPSMAPRCSWTMELEPC